MTKIHKEEGEINKKKVRITFCTGAGVVTGSNFLFEIAGDDNTFETGKKVLIDCGLLQSTKLADEANWEPFSFDPKTIDILFITHAHIDHIGRIPKLIHDGFFGKIYSTEATKDLAAPMLEDTMAVLDHAHDPKIEEMYTKEIVTHALSIWHGFPYYQTIKLDDEITVYFKDSGHILGSAIIEFKINGKKVVFTGDLGNSPSPLLRDTDVVNDADYLIMESVYGDRNHESRDDRVKLFKKIIMDNYHRKGTLIMPTFSLERSQDLLYEINNMLKNKEIPVMPVYLDSPLAIKLTDVYYKHSECFNEQAKADAKSEKDIFDFPGLHLTEQTEESKAILRSHDPKIIIAGSGMSNGGRIIHHEANYLPNRNDTLLLTGYQSLGTLGRAIEEGAKHVHVAGVDVAVHARIEKIDGYSGHKDSDHLVEFVANTADRVKQIFVVLGEPKSSLFLAQKIRDNLNLNVKVPEHNEVVVLEL